MADKKLGVKCPVCKKSFYYYDSKFRPFCSERCKSIDLARWSSEDYTLGCSEPLSEADLEQVIRHHSGEEYEH